MRNLTVFYALLSFIFFISCGENAQKGSDNKAAEVEKKNDLIASGTKKILFYGNSLTAGMGLNVDEAFPALIQNKIDSLGLAYEVINAGLSGETSSGGLSRINWVLNQKIDVFVLELGGNDGLRGIPLDQTRKNLQAIIDFVHKKNSDTKIVLAGMQIPPNMGQAYTTEFKQIFPDLAKKNKAYLIPFLLKDVGGIPELNQPDGIHPTAEGHKIVANNVWAVLRSVIGG